LRRRSCFQRTFGLEPRPIAAKLTRVKEPRRRWSFVVSIPERVVRAGAALIGGALHETAQLVLPRFLRRSRLYEATAKNLLRISIELVGGVEAAASPEPGPGAGELAVRKTAGNVVELGSIAAFGFSPLWLLAAAADVSRGSRVYLAELVSELKAADVLPEEVDVGSIDELLDALEQTSGRSARLVDIPPVELGELRRSVAELRAEATDLPSADELRALYEGLRRAAAEEDRSLLEVSSGVGLAFLVSARNVGRTHLVVPYREDWRPVRREGFGAYAERVAGPYRRAIEGHLDPARPTLTERALQRLRPGRREPGA
jgi:hypothetical protein